MSSPESDKLRHMLASLGASTGSVVTCEMRESSRGLHNVSGAARGAQNAIDRNF
jgi:hypothetical protein